MAATFDIHTLPDTEIGDRIQCQGTVSFPDRENHDPEGEELEEMLTFEVNVYMPQDEEDRNEAMQAYADDYEQGYWQAVADGHRATE